MREYVLVTDSGCDMSKEYLEKNKIDCADLSFVLDGKEYIGSFAMKPREFYDLLRAGNMSKSAQANVGQFEEIFEKHAAAGNDVLYVGFSSGLSGTYNSGAIAAARIAEKYSDWTAITVDTLAASMGEGLLLDYALRNKQNGMSLDENAAWLEENKLKLCHWFTVDDLAHLCRGGRVSKTAALVGTMLGIKPVLHVDNQGHLIAMEKVRGRKKSLEAIVEHMKKTAIEPASQRIFISHGDCLDEAKQLGALIEKEWGIKDITYGFVGPVIGTHSGPGTLALFFIGEYR